VPLVNPDGRVNVLAGATEWRKNMRARPDGVTCPPHSIAFPDTQTAANYGEQSLGVDLNRNFDVGWDSLLYAKAWFDRQRVAFSDNPCDDTYHGPSAASEPETQFVQDLINGARPKSVLDVHTGSGG